MDGLIKEHDMTLNRPLRELFISLLILFPIIVHGQIIESDKIDPFNGSREIKTSFVSLKGSFKIQLAAIASKTDTTFAMNFYFPANVTSIDDHSGVLFKLSDSSVFNFPYLGDYKLCSSLQLCNIFISLNRNDIENFLKDKVTIIRIKTSSSVMDFNIKEKRALMIDKLINLLLNQLEKTE